MLADLALAAVGGSGETYPQFGTFLWRVLWLWLSGERRFGAAAVGHRLNFPKWICVSEAGGGGDDDGAPLRA